MESPRANLQIKWLDDDATTFGPKILEPPGKVLESHGHDYVLISLEADAAAKMQSGIVSELEHKENISAWRKPASVNRSC